MSLPPPLSAKDKNSFAYETVKDRLPLIVTRIVDFLARHRSDILHDFGEDADRECKSCIGAMDKLRYEIARDKPIVLLGDQYPDVEIWNRCLQDMRNKGQALSWFQSPWLLVECYMYRCIMQAFYLTKHMNTTDPFYEMKQRSFLASENAAHTLLSQLDNDLQMKNTEESTLREQFSTYMEISLWGNRCDLSLSAGSDSSQNHDPFHQLSELKQCLLINHESDVYQYIVKQHSDDFNHDIYFDLILDNAGFELLGDLCLADFLISKRLCSRLTLHLKMMPWFVSDATRQDLDWLFSQLEKSQSEIWQKTVERWKEHVKNGQWIITAHQFYTLPFDYSQMRKYSSDLYTSLTNSHLLIFKGDLNYRKLVGDLKWNLNDKFDYALRGFHPTSLVVLRTLKSDVQLELDEQSINYAKNLDSNWMVTGQFGVIQWWKKPDV
ncbi:unnamed protein product [Didymodactylos carnosus]|uniref:Sugar phosphate phosphatase n=1 Tax=Didymodactylos carnosus TaxID=1234261 RepID=A0A813UN52_9BILA|nr:unnamed protein product [Didymodactylos carnosus]CAF0831502.1 unnamed protein product [Didymodactylos carnosus]CAF3615153.1 unnamed protein product [Didymodactylos carnosus]CAF3618580.1 unnamed protein product [Didymodactylos carnosus]